MILKIDIEFNLLENLYSDLKQFIKEQICKRKGHIWEDYNVDGFDYFLFIARHPDKFCKRCGATIYKDEKKVKPAQTIKFRRYNKLEVKNKKEK